VRTDHGLGRPAHPSALQTGEEAFQLPPEPEHICELSIEVGDSPFKQRADMDTRRPTLSPNVHHGLDLGQREA
jgi:hypothetical protein